MRATSQLTPKVLFTHRHMAVVASYFVKAFLLRSSSGSQYNRKKKSLFLSARRWLSTVKMTSTSRETKRPRNPVKIAFSPPETWEETLSKIREMRKMNKAPVDTMGCDKCHDESADDKTKRFQTLVSLMLSSQTKDEVTFAAMERLKADGELSAERMVEIDEGKLAELLKPVGFYKRKAGYIKRASQMLLDDFEGDVPKSIEDLLKLPGVGNKMGYLCLANAWGINDGIGVDTHVHRIAGRLGWTSGSESVEKTREELEGWLPKELWQEVNHTLVGFGQTICSPVGPKCSDCLCNDTCPSAFKKKAPTPKKKK